MADRMIAYFSRPLIQISIWLNALSFKLGQLHGWRRALAAAVFGFLSALAFPPTNITPVLWICFPALIFLLRGTDNAKQAFATGWFFAFGFFLLGLYWIADAMFVDIAHFWWAVPLAVAGLPVLFAINYGLAAALARTIGLQGVTGTIFFALLWFLADYARGHILTGFPWILMGHAWSIILPIQQFVSITGIYGLTLLTLIGASIPASLVDNGKAGRTAFCISILCFLCLGAWGTWRLTHDTGASASDIRLRLVQPNIDQVHKWNGDEREAHFLHLLDLTSAIGEKPITHVVWPETAATFYLMEDAEHRRAIAAALPPQGSLLTGVIRREFNHVGHLDYYNSMVAINSEARVVAGYDKVHLVPFGEYIPFRRIIPMRTLANLGLDFSTGDGIRSLRVAGLPSFSPLICYEAIFPGSVIDDDDRPHFLLNITNDGWYGHTAGPYQHFAIVKLRAIEEGLPLVRVANTGISGVIDSYGRVTARLGVGKNGFIDADLPVASTATLFSKYREIPLWILFSFLLLPTVLCRYHTMKVFRRS